MPKPRQAKLETATARRRLEARKKPYWTTISPGVGLGYRRNAGPGTWSVRGTDGHGSDWIKRLGLADDFEPADGAAVLSYWQALDAARKAARGISDEGGARPPTVNEALDRYAADLTARGGDPYNATGLRAHLSSAMLARLVSALTANELRKWRDSLLAKGLTPSSVNRIRTRLKAALALASRLDERITNASAWRIGLAGIPDAHRARDVALTDAETLRLIKEARAIDPRLGLYIETLAVTGARASQAARLTVGDLQADRLMLPTSKKGRGVKVIKHIPVPIPEALAAALAIEAQGRSANEPLLRRPDGAPWGHGRASHHTRTLFRKVVSAAGLHPDRVTSYALRHTNVIRQLRRNVPIRLVASLHDTSVAIIERNYAKHIARHGDELARGALLDTSTLTDVALPEQWS